MSYAAQAVQTLRPSTVSPWFRTQEVPVYCFPLPCCSQLSKCWTYMTLEISPTTWVCHCTWLSSPFQLAQPPGAGLSGSHSQGLGRSTTLSNWLMNPQVEGGFGDLAKSCQGDLRFFCWKYHRSNVLIRRLTKKKLQSMWFVFLLFFLRDLTLASFRSKQLL